MLEVFLFQAFSRMTRGSARAVISVSHPVHAVLSLILSFVSACALMRRLQVEFMALIFIVVYVGAIAVLFLFVVMMLNLNSLQGNAGKGIRRSSESGSRTSRGRVMGIGRMRRSNPLRSSSRDSASLTTSNQNRPEGIQSYVQWVERIDPMTSLETMGQVLYTHKFVYLLMAGFVLLVARVGAIVLTLQVRTFARAKRQQVHHQRSRDPSRALMMTRVTR